MYNNFVGTASQDDLDDLEMVSFMTKTKLHLLPTQIQYCKIAIQKKIGSELYKLIFWGELMFFHSYQTLENPFES